jgi:hypothetical protein
VIGNRIFVSELDQIGAITLNIVIDPAGGTPKTRFPGE